MRTDKPRRVAVTGLGMITPLGLGLPETWAGLLSGRSGAGPITRFDPSALKTQIAAEVKGFDPGLYMDRKAVRRLDPFIQYAVAASRMALEDSGLDLEKEDQELAGCALGCGLGGLKTMEENHALIYQGRADRVSPFFIPMIIGNMAAGQVAIELGLKGPNYLSATACAAGTHAVGLSYQLIRDYGYQIMVTGGTESVMTPLAVAGFNSIKALSTRNHEPQLASRPFDRDRDGFVLGEGSGILILEEMDRALSRGAKVYAEVLGFGASCDAFHITAPRDDGQGAIAAMRLALADAAQSSGLIPADIGYINAHGTSTGLNDRIETMAIKEVFGDLAPSIPVSSTKSMTGHLLGAAGGVEAAVLCLAIRDEVLPPPINLENPDEGLDLDYLPKVKREAKGLKAAMSNSFGFGGTNGVVILGRAGAFPRSS